MVSIALQAVSVARRWAIASVLVALAFVPGFSNAATISKAEVYFRLANPCPSTGEIAGPCQGYVVDRIIPIACGGAEEPANMQWQTLAEAKEKDKWERIGCRRGRKLVLPGTSNVSTEAYALGESPPPVEAQPLPPR